MLTMQCMPCSGLTISFSGSNSTETPIRAIWKALPDGTEYLIAVNVDKGRVTGRFDFGAAAESGRITAMKLLFEAVGVSPTTTVCFQIIGTLETMHDWY